MDSIIGQEWSYNLPIFILDRCWLRLEKIKLSELKQRIEIDNSGEAPELVRYQQLTRNGHTSLLAAQECWKEFGIEDFHRALRNCWEWKDRGNNGWTFKTYRTLIKTYQQSINDSIQEVPLIILARKNSQESHQLKWLRINSLS